MAKRKPRPLRAAVIGVGRVGHLFSKDPKIEGIYSHTGGYVACGDTNLVAICDIDEAALAEAGDDLKIPPRMRFTDVEQVLDRAKPEIVSISTPDDSHLILVQRCLLTESVRGVLCEKPVAHTAGHVEALVALANEVRKPVAVHTRAGTRRLTAICVSSFDPGISGIL